MTYKQIAIMAEDEDLLKRNAGCIATQSNYEVPAGLYPSPPAIASHIRWECAGQPGWGAAYEYAINSNVERPGNDEAVITDGMILSAVQAVLGIE